MKIKKLISLLLAAMLTITSNFNCFAVGPDEGCDSDDSLSDIVIPDSVPIDDGLEERVRLNEQRAQQLLEQLDRSDAKIVELRAIYARNKSELDRINRMLCQTTRERDGARIQADVAREELQQWRDDVLCTECFCFRNPVDEVRSLIRGDINRTPPNSIWRSKRFYKGMVAGIVLVLVILVGGYVYVHYLQLPARSE